MKTSIKSLIVASSLASGAVFAQETMDLKVSASIPPTFYHQVALAAGFSNANGGTVDLFAKNGKDIVSVPNNYVGSQDAVSGDAYFGLITYYGTGSLSLKKAVESRLSDWSSDDVVNYGEYLQASLPKNLTAGKEYEVSIKVSLADNSGFATSGWGAYFSDNASTGTNNARLSVTPQLSFSEMVKDKSAWTELKAKFKATGSEKFMTVGCFNNGYKSENIGGGKGFAGNKAYYYVSALMITEVAMDRDKDGILDKDDKCPDVAGLTAFVGCPDTDGDGVQDSEDTCPTVAGLSQFKGCPDTDGDGIQDSEDKCPTVAGIAAQYGCPEMKIDKKALEVFTKAMSGIQFESGKDVIKKTSYGILDNVVTVLKENPTWYTTIEGHTDNVGNVVKNKELSHKRAVAVEKYLVDHGCSDASLTPMGYGVERPIADNKTAAGKAKNRRVEFKVTYAQ